MSYVPTSVETAGNESCATEFGNSVEFANTVESCGSGVASLASRALGASLQAGTLPQQATQEFRPLNGLQRWFRQALVKRLSSLTGTSLCLRDAEESIVIGDAAEGRLLAAELDSIARIDIHNPRAYQLTAAGGSLGAAEAYIRGDWDTPDLVQVMRAMSHHTAVMLGLERGFTKLKNPFRLIQNWFRGNSKTGSRKNISAHYDLSNEFFEQMLDPTMTYSSGIFPSANASLEHSSIEKYDRICRQLQLRPSDHVLEIGCGWGGFAMFAASRYGCHVTATTISTEQYQYAKDEIHKRGLEDRITLLKKDYRDLTGSYDKLVSIEMVEAVGERYLNRFFATCSSRLKRDGMMMLQAITIPDDRYSYYCNSVDFIRRYVFPGGFLPSFSAIGQSLRQATDFRLAGSADFGLHYGETLKRWRENFWENIAAIRDLGFDERFIRTWHYYLCYCEAGFRERQIGVSQLLLLKPGCRDAAVGIPFSVPQSV